MTHNKSLQRTFDPPPIFANAKAGAVSNAAELRRYAQKEERMKTTIQVISYLILLGVSVVLGFMGKPAEMGLAIVAGAIGLAFSDIGKFSRIKGAGFEAELREKLEVVEAVIEKETEPSISGEESTTPRPNVSKIDASTKAVIKALQHPVYTWRYLGGIKKDTGLSEHEVTKSLRWLAANGYAKQTLGKHGTVWNLTEEGRYLSAVIDFSQ